MRKSIFLKITAGILLLIVLLSAVSCRKKEQNTGKVYSITNGNPDMTLTLDGENAKITTVVTTSLGDETMEALGLADALRDTVVKEVHTTILEGTFKTLDNGGVSGVSVRCAHTLLGLAYTGDGAEDVLRIEIERHQSLAAEARTAGDPDGTASQYDAYVEMLESGELIEATRLGYGQYDMGYVFSLDESEMTATLKKQSNYDENGVVLDECTFSEDGSVVSENKYANGVLVEADEFFASGRLSHKIVYQAPNVPDYERFYNENGEIVHNALYDQNGKLIREDYYDGQGCYHGVDYYENGQTRAEELYDANGVFSVFREFTENGDLTYEEKPVGDGTFEGFFFENGVKTGKKILNGQGKIIYEATFDASGNIVTEQKYDENGEPIPAV